MAIDPDKDRRFNDGDGDEPDDTEPEWFGISISRVANGFLCEASDGRVDVFEEPLNATADPDPDTVARMLWRIVEHFGAIGSKHDARRIYIDVQPGDDYPDQTKH
jgi:hypothetical protein